MASAHTFCHLFGLLSLLLGSTCACPTFGTGVTVTAAAHLRTSALLVGYKPLIAHRVDSAANQINFTQCSDALCSSASTVTKALATSSVDTRLSLVIQAQNPLLVYANDQNFLAWFSCTDDACNGGTNNSASGKSNPGGVPPNSTAVRNMYSTANNSTLSRTCVGCGSPRTMQLATLVAPPPYLSFPLLMGVALDDSGRPVIAFRIGNGELRFIKCSSALCDFGVTVVSPTPKVVLHSACILSVTVPAGGNPVVAFCNETGDLQVYVCKDTSCSTGTLSPSLRASVANASSTASSVQLTVATSCIARNPIISFTDVNGTLGIVECKDRNCNTSTANNLTTNAAFASMVIQPQPLPYAGMPFISFSRRIAADQFTLSTVICYDGNCSTCVESYPVLTPCGTPFVPPTTPPPTTSPPPTTTPPTTSPPPTTTPPSTSPPPTNTPPTTSPPPTTTPPTTSPPPTTTPLTTSPPPTTTRPTTSPPPTTTVVLTTTAPPKSVTPSPSPAPAVTTLVPTTAPAPRPTTRAPTLSTLPSPAGDAEGGKGLSSGAKIGIGVGCGVVGLLAIAGLAVLLYNKLGSSSTQRSPAHLRYDANNAGL